MTLSVERAESVIGGANLNDPQPVWLVLSVTWSIPQV